VRGASGKEGGKRDLVAPVGGPKGRGKGFQASERCWTKSDGKDPFLGGEAMSNSKGKSRYKFARSGTGKAAGREKL